MARDTRTFYTGKGSIDVLRNLAAMIATGKNSDDTDFVPSVTGKDVTATPVATGTADALGKAAATGLKLVGVVARETGAIPAIASLNIRHGIADTGPVLIPINLLASGSFDIVIPAGGIPCASGLFVERTAGDSEVLLLTTV